MLSLALQRDVQYAQQVHTFLHATIAVHRLHGRDILRAGQRLAYRDRSHVVLVVISRSLHPVHTAVKSRHIRQHRAGPCTMPESHQVHKWLEGGTGRAWCGCAIQRTTAGAFRASRRQGHQHLARAVICHHHRRLGNIAVLQTLHFLAGNGGTAALQARVQGELTGYPLCRSRGIDTPGLHAQRSHHRLTHTQQNQIAAFQRRLGMPHRVELRGRFHQRDQQGGLRRGQLPCPLAEIKVSRRLSPAAHIAEIGPVQVGSQQFFLGMRHFQAPRLQHLAQLGAQIARRGRAVHLSHLHADGTGTGFPLPAPLLPGGAQQGQHIHPSVGIKPLILCHQQGMHQLRGQSFQRLAAVTILPRHIAQ